MIPTRAGLPRKGCSEAEFEAWVAAATERADPVMAWLGVLFALLVGYEVAVELSDEASRALQIAGWVIWTAFALEFAAKLSLAPEKARFLRRHVIQAAGLVLPFLRVLRLVRLVRLGRALPAGRVLAASYRTAGSSRRLLRSRLGYLGALSTIAIVAAAELAYLFERDAADGAFESFGDALIWAAAVIIGLSADPRPETTGAQLVMLCGFAFGLVVIASLAATAGAFLLGSEREDRR